jgi:serine/threonine protein kinase/sugar lactone lactonase YvrE
MPDGETHQQSQARLVAGRYLLLNELGRGGMGTVWLADDPLVHRHVAVKELRPPQGLPAEREVFAQRALSEATSAARVRHPGAVTLYDVLPATADDDAVYLIMELIEGPTLAQLIQSRGPLPDAVAAGYGLQLLDVLDAAHALGIVHRDVKPANIIITPAGQAKLTDFGIAHVLGDARLTRSGVMGTQAYMAPELFESQPITPAADLWALGATLYAATCGHGPFDRDSTAATLRAILLDDVPAPRCSPALAAAITGLLQRDPAHRATGGQTRAALRRTDAQSVATRQRPARPVPAPQGDGTTTVHRPIALPVQPTPDQATPTSEQPETTLSPTAGPAQVPARTGPPQRKPRRWRLIIAVSAAIVIAVAGGVTGGILAQGNGHVAQGDGHLNTTLSLRATITDQRTPSSPDAIAFSPNGALMATNDVYDNAALWNTATGTRYEKMSGTAVDCTCVAFSPDGRTVAIPGSGTTIQLWNVPGNSVDYSLNSGLSALDGIAFSPDGSKLAAVGSQGLQLWNVASRQSLTTLGASGPELLTAAFSPDGKLIAASDEDGDVYVWNVSSGSLIATLAPFGKGPGIYAWPIFSPDGSKLALAGIVPSGPPYGPVRLWDVVSRTWGGTLIDPDSKGDQTAAFSPDGRVLAVGDNNGNVYLWSTVTHKLIDTQHVNNSGTGYVVFSPDGKTLATGDLSGHIYLWSVSGG